MISKVYPEEDDLFGSMNRINSFRNIKLKDATIIISPKVDRSKYRSTGIKSGFCTSNDNVLEDLHDHQDRLRTFVKQILILLRFFKLLQESQEETRAKQSHVIPRKGLFPLYPDHWLVLIWHRFVDFLTFLAIVIYPLYLSFAESSIVTMTYIIDCLLSIDLLISMLTCVIDSNNNLIAHWKQIIIYNLKNWWLFDLISLFPYRLLFDDIDSYSDSDFWVLLKLLRIIKYFFHRRKLYFIITEQQVDEFKKPYIDWNDILDRQFVVLAQMYRNMFILVNLFGCLWAFLQRFEMQQSISYITAIYWSMQTVTVVGYGDSMPTTFMQFTLTIIWMLVGVGFYSFTIGNLASILQQLNSHEDHETELDQIDELFSQVLVPEQFQNQVFSYLCYNLENNVYWVYRQQLEVLPLNLQKSAISITSYFVIRNIHFFSMDLNSATRMLPRFNVNYYQQYETIYLIGAASQEVYFLVTGEVRLTNLRGDTLLNIHEGFIFGEIEVIDNVNRKYQAVASAGSVVLMCPNRCFFETLDNNEDLQFELEQLALRRKILIEDAMRRGSSKTYISSKATILDPRKSVSNYLLQKNRLEHEFRVTINKQSFQAQQNQIISYILGKKSERKRQLKGIFKMAINKIIQYNRTKVKSPKKQLFNVDIKKQFHIVVNQEQKILDKVSKNVPTYKRSLRDLMDEHKGIHLHQSSKAKEVMFETKTQKLIKVEREQQKLQYSQRLVKIDLRGRLYIINTLYDKLDFALGNLEIHYDQAQDHNDGLHQEIFEIQNLIKSLAMN